MCDYTPIEFFRSLLEYTLRNARADSKHGQHDQQCDQPPQMTMTSRGHGIE